MELAELKERLLEVEQELAGRVWVVLRVFEREGRALHLALTERLLVSHHLRLLGVLCRKEAGDWLILVDCDRSAPGRE